MVLMILFLLASNLPCPNEAGGTFFVSVNQISRQILYLSECECDQIMDLGQIFTTKYLKWS